MCPSWIDDHYAIYVPVLLNTICCVFSVLISVLLRAITTMYEFRLWTVVTSPITLPYASKLRLNAGLLTINIPGVVVSTEVMDSCCPLLLDKAHGPVPVKCARPTRLSTWLVARQVLLRSRFTDPGLTVILLCMKPVVNRRLGLRNITLTWFSSLPSP